MSRAVNTALAPVWGTNNNGALLPKKITPSSSTNQVKKSRTRTKTTSTVGTAPLTVSLKHNIVSSSSPSQSPSFSVAEEAAGAKKDFATTPVSPLPSSSRFPVQNNNITKVVAQQPQLLQQQKSSRTKINAAICAQTCHDNTSNARKTPSNPSSSSFNVSSTLTPATIASAVATASTPSSRLQLRLQQQQQQQQQNQQHSSPLPRIRLQQQQQLQQQRRRYPRPRAMTWLDHHAHIPSPPPSVTEKDSNRTPAQSLPPTPLSPLSPLPRAKLEEDKVIDEDNYEDEEETCDFDQEPLDFKDQITGDSNEYRYDNNGRLENGLDSDDNNSDDENDFDDHDLEEDLKSFLILNGTAGQNGGTVEVISWLQEAIQTVNILESRVQELEQDCSSIPLYEQNRIQMTEVIQGLDEMVVQDRQWIEHTENAVQWAAHVLEEALLGSFPPFSPMERTPTSTVTAPTTTRLSRSEGMLPDLVATAEDIMGASERRMEKRRGILYDEETVAAATTSSIVSTDSTRAAAQYRSSIQAALRHLRTVEHSKSLSSCSGSVVGGGDSNENQSGDVIGRRRATPAPDRTLKTWLDNASSTSLTSSNAAMTVDESPLELDNDDEDEDVQALEERRDSINKAACSPSIPTRSFSSTSQQQKQQSSLSTDPLSLSAISLQATLSGSSQSILPNTYLGDPCLVDERIYLKQHVQNLEQLRLQELDRHRSIELGYGQLVQDLARFSNEMLQAVNTLTVAQAALDGANELSLMTLRMVEKEDEEIIPAAPKPESVANVKKSHRLLLQTPSHRQKRTSMIHNSCHELTESVGLIELEIRKMRRMAADCVGITELAQERLDGCSGSDDNASTTASSTLLTPSTTIGVAASIKTVTTATTERSVSPAQQLQHQSGRSSLSTTTPAAYVDGLAFQEFEAHLVTIRNHRNANGLVMTPFMKRVLMEDIQPCLLLHAFGANNHRQNDSRQNINGGSGRWMSSLLGSTHQSATSFSSQTPVAWLSKLLGAMEKNACEIELQKLEDSSKVSTSGASGECCCLCRLTRLCDFRLRIIEDETTSSTISSTTQINSRTGPPSSILSKGTTGNSSNSYYHPLDRFCRDRVVAVCDFYMFLAHLRQGLLDHQPSLELFRRALLLRHRMGQARIGSVDLTVSASTTGITSH
ncbi:hypothetical protein BGZ83_005846 [Gryganskiella cystojenkinii]|nr:hypothetical protein BGZ83_005846 [Gryganskiella cystojenkinii]